MKVAIVHDHLLVFGGAERVLIALLKLYPHADVYTAFATHGNISLFKSLTTGRIFTSPYNQLPFSHEFADWFKPLIFFNWESLDFTSYDLVISSSHSFSSKSVITQPRTLHIAYIHTPPRYLYTEFNETQIIKRSLFKLLLSPLMTWLRLQDYIGAQRPDVLIANSKTVQKRIKKYYRRDSIVIYSPVNIPKNFLVKKKSDYFLVVSRLVKQKGIALAIKVCNNLKLPLVVIGEGNEGKYLRSIAGPTISFKGFTPDNEMPNIYAGAKALLYCSKEEDFGIVPVEALAHGVPVIAYDSGAVTETIINGKTGMLFEGYSLYAITQAMHRFLKTKIDFMDCRNQARKFSRERFNREFLALISTKIDKLKFVL